MGHKYANKMCIRFKMMHKYNSEVSPKPSRLQGLQHRTNQRRKIRCFCFPSYLKLLTWEYKQLSYIINKKINSFNGKHDVLNKSFLFVTTTLLHFSVAEHQFSTVITAALHRRHFPCHCPPTAVLLFWGVMHTCARTRRHHPGTRNTRNTERCITQNTCSHWIKWRAQLFLLHFLHYLLL